MSDVAPKHTVTAIDYAEASPEQRKRKRLQYGIAQGGRCWHCEGKLIGPPPIEFQEEQEHGQSLTVLGAIEAGVFPPNFLDSPVHLHHSHRTGLTIGAVHAWCNAALWLYYGE